MLHFLGKTYGVRPSDYLLTLDPQSSASDRIFCMDFDATCLTLGGEEEARRAEDQRRQQQSG